MDERRSTPRSRTYLAGQVAFHHRQATMDCIVRNFSRSGARLDFANTVGVPGEFEVTVRHKGESRRGRTIWQTERSVGIAFDEGASAAVISIEGARRSRQLEAECDRLRRRIAQLSEPA